MPGGIRMQFLFSDITDEFSEKALVLAFKTTYGYEHDFYKTFYSYLLRHVFSRIDNITVQKEKDRPPMDMTAVHSSGDDPSGSSEEIFDDAIYAARLYGPSSSFSFKLGIQAIEPDNVVLLIIDSPGFIDDFFSDETRQKDIIYDLSVFADHLEIQTSKYIAAQSVLEEIRKTSRERLPDVSDLILN